MLAKDSPMHLDEDSIEEKESDAGIHEDECEDVKKEEESEDTEESESDSDTMDDEESEVRRTRYLQDMTDLEMQFVDLKEQLFKERIKHIDEQLDNVNNSEAQEYIGPLKQLENDFITRNDVADHLKNYGTSSLENKLNCEIQQANQHFENEERALYVELRNDLEEKLRKTEDERHSADMYSDLWCDDTFKHRKKRKGMDMFIPDRRKKPLTVTGPYIIYMIKDMEIMEDWALIRKAKLDLARREFEEVKEENGSVVARYENGKFFYMGDWFQKGEKVFLDNRIDNPVIATITAINTVEVWVTKESVKAKLAISRFQSGKYTMRRYIPDEIS